MPIWKIEDYIFASACTFMYLHIFITLKISLEGIWIRTRRHGACSECILSQAQHLSLVYNTLRECDNSTAAPRSISLNYKVHGQRPAARLSVSKAEDAFKSKVRSVKRWHVCLHHPTWYGGQGEWGCSWWL